MHVHVAFHHHASTRLEVLKHAFAELSPLAWVALSESLPVGVAVVPGPPVVGAPEVVASVEGPTVTLLRPPSVAEPAPPESPQAVRESAKRPMLAHRRPATTSHTMVSIVTAPRRRCQPPEARAGG